MRVFEALAFLGLAGGLHVAAFAVTSPQTSGADGGGDQGAETITLAALPDGLSALVQDWETPPEIMSDTGAVTHPLTDLPVSHPAPILSAKPADMLAPLQAPQKADIQPTAETRLPAPATLETNITSAPEVPKISPPPRLALPTGVALPHLPVMSAARPMDIALDERPTLENRSPAPRSLSPDQPFAPKPPMDDALKSAKVLETPTRPRLPERPTLPEHMAAFEAPIVDQVSREPSLAPETSLRPKARTKALRPKSPAKAAARPAQRAKGNGSSKEAAPTRKAKPASKGPSKAALQSAQAKWGSQIRSKIARAQRYPNGTRAKGTVTLRIVVTRTGKLSSLTITRSSGNSALDRAALRAAKSARLPAAPKLLNKPTYAFNLPLRFAR